MTEEVRDRIARWLEMAGAKKIRNTGVDNIVSTCPFHGDRSPSFSIRSDNGLFLCYAQGCGVQGNLINFLVSALGWSFKRARRAAERLDIPTLDDPALVLPAYGMRHIVDDGDEEKSTITEGQLGIYDFCPRYMVRRGFDRKVLKRWEIGYDYGTQRVTIPVRDEKGRLVGVTKRATLKYQEDHMGKYLHLGFRKSRYLYGLTHAREGPIVVVEGQLDAIALHQLDLGVNPVATMGARVSNRQIDALAKLRRPIILAFDNDKDGYAAMQRVGDHLASRVAIGRLRAVRWEEGVHDFGDLVTDRQRAERILGNADQYMDVMLDVVLR